jgi:hypothetical protein
LGPGKVEPNMGKMQGMMTQMPEKKPVTMGKLDMCPMMRKMDNQAKKIKVLEERLDNLEKARGKST